MNIVNKVYGLVVSRPIVTIGFVQILSDALEFTEFSVVNARLLF